MKRFPMGVMLAGVLLAGVCVAGEQGVAVGGGGMGVGAGAPGAGGSEKAKAKHWFGELSVAPTNADASVVAVLTQKRGENSKTYNLTCADAETAAKIKADAAKGATVGVAGDLSQDGKSIAVTKCFEPQKDRPHGKRHGEKTAAPEKGAPTP